MTYLEILVVAFVIQAIHVAVTGDVIMIPLN